MCTHVILKSEDSRHGLDFNLDTTPDSTCDVFINRSSRNIFFLSNLDSNDSIIN